MQAEARLPANCVLFKTNAVCRAATYVMAGQEAHATADWPHLEDLYVQLVVLVCPATGTRAMDKYDRLD